MQKSFALILTKKKDKKKLTSINNENIKPLRKCAL